MKEMIKRLLARTPYRLVHRTQLNRFQAIDESLAMLAARGFSPRMVLDCGANIGAFSALALKLFPDASVHAIEPQPGCQTALANLKAQAGERFFAHAVALCDPDTSDTTLTLSTDHTATSTGAHVNPDGDGILVCCQTLDAVLAPFGEANAPALLKLDLQGYELHALRGGAKTLASTEVILTEVSFYAQAFEPSIATLIAFLAAHGFELYDIASLYARPRDDRPRQGDFIFVRSTSALAADRAWA